MKKIIFIIISFCSSYFFYAQKNNLAPAKPVTDEYFGTKIIDKYRNLENLQDSETLNWAKSQTDYANVILSKIPKGKYYLNKRLEFEKRQGFSVSELKITDNDKYFYLKKDADSRTAKLYYRNGISGKEKLLYDPEDFNAANQNSDEKNDFVINYINPSRDGSRIVISLSENGKEVSETIIMDVRTKYIYPDTISNTQPANTDGIKWLDDNSGFFYVYFPNKDSSSEDFHRNTRTVLYKIGTKPQQLIEIFQLKIIPI
jgi:prolyl oligopeptidase